MTRLDGESVLPRCGPRSRVRALPALSLLTLLAFATPVLGTDWDGSASTSWFNAANWSAGVPTATTDAVINPGLPRYPVLTANGAVCRDLVVRNGGSLSLSTFAVEVRRNLIVQSPALIASTATGRIRFAGNGASEIQNALTFAGDIECAKTGAAVRLQVRAPLSCNDVFVTSGGLAFFLLNFGTQTIGGNLAISAGGRFDRTWATLDILGSVTNAGTFNDGGFIGSTSVAGNWTDSGTFTTGTRTVTFDGGGTSLITVPDSGDFYNITITNNTTARATTAIDINGTLRINPGSVFDADGDLDVTGGAVTCVGTGRLLIGSTTTSFGTFTAGLGRVEYDSTTAAQTIRAASYYDLRIAKGTTIATAASTFAVGHDVMVDSGTLAITAAGDVTVVGAVSVGGTLLMTGAGDLRLGTSVTVSSGGTFRTGGSPKPIVTNDGAGDYTFTISSGGTVDIDGLDLRNIESTGLTIGNDATIAAIRGIDFTSIDPDADGANDTFLRVLEDAADVHTFIAISFDASCTFNVSTAPGTAIDIRMIVPSGAKGIEAFESEGTPGSIDWPPITRSWIGGDPGNQRDWDVAANWSPPAVPTSADDCWIPDVIHNPVLNTTGTVRSIYIDTGGSLTIDDPETMIFAGDLIIHGSGTFDMTDGLLLFNGAGGQVIADLGGTAVAIHDLTVNKSAGALSSTVDLTLTGDLTVADGELAVASRTITVAGPVDIVDTLSLSTGLVDANGAFDAAGGTIVFGGAGRLRLGGAVTSLGTLIPGTGTVEYDDTSAARTIAPVGYFDLEIDNGIRVALTGGDITVADDLVITTGELEVDDGDTLRVDDDVTVAGRLDLEPGSTLELAAATTLSVTGVFEAIGGASDLALVTTSDPGTPGRYSFSIAAGGRIIANHVFFEFMDAAGIRITDTPAVQALTQLADAYFSNGASGGTLLAVVNNDNAVTLPALHFVDASASLASNVATTSSTAAITINPYAGAFGGPSFENDNGGGTVTPGFVIWGALTPVTLLSFAATPVPAGVLLEWETDAEWRSLGFSLERAAPGGAFLPIGPALLPATGIAPGGDRYRFLDDTAGAAAGAHYRLTEIDSSGHADTIARATALPSPAPAASAARRAALVAPRLSAAGAPVAGTRGSPPQVVAGALPMTAAPPAAGSSVDAVRIRVEPEGIVRLTHAELAAAGFPVGAPPANFRLRRDDARLPIAIIGGADGSFDPGDAIDFLAEPFAHLETRSDTYFLELAPPGEGSPPIPEVDASPPGVAASVGSSPATLEVEGQDLYVLSIADGDGRDHFFDEFIVAPGTLDIGVDLDRVAATGDPAILEIVLEGWSDDPFSSLDHLARVLWDGIELGELSRDGAGPFEGSFEVPAALAGSGTHTITVVADALAAPSILYLDRARVTWRREHVARADRLSAALPAGAVSRLDGFSAAAVEIYRTGGAGSPERLTGAVASAALGAWSLELLPPGEGTIEAFTPARARSAMEIAPVGPGGTVDPAFGADWLAIAPDALSSEIAPLAALRRSQGLRVAVVSLEEIYDRFDGGRPTTAAIERFLAYAKTTWRAPAPAYLLLVGDATYDPAGHLGPSPRQVLPTPLIEVNGLESASDAGLADPDGDGATDLAIGRFPVASAQECQDLVAKTIGYEVFPGAAPTPRVLFVADDESEFDGVNASLEALLPPAVVAVHLDLAVLPLAPLRAALLGAEWVDATIVHYSGHGSRLRFADEGILQVGDVPMLPADPRPPVVVAMNCWNGFFQHPLTPSLGEALLLAPDRGAIAYFGPSAVTTTVGQQALAEEIAARLLSGAAGRLGDEIQLARWALAGDPATREVLATWVLLGDPALIVR